MERLTTAEAAEARAEDREEELMDLQKGLEDRIASLEQREEELEKARARTREQENELERQKGDLMLASMQEIQDNAPNFHSYIAPGTMECITGQDIFYSREVEGVQFSDWVDAMVNDEAWDDVMCTDCETDPEAP